MRRISAVIAAVGLTLTAVGVAVTPAGAGPDRSSDRMTISDLRHSVVPAYCQMPRQRLHHNATARRYLPKQGWMNFDPPGQPIFVHLQPGPPDLVATYRCTAGGVSWPQVIVAYGPHGRLVDALFLSDYRPHQEHSDVTQWRAAGHSIRMRWISYQGAGFDRHRSHSLITLRNDELVLHPIR
jgi:hypothetical protein